MEIAPLKDWWWLLLTVFGILVALVRNVIKIHEAMEALKRVKEHETQLISIKGQYDNIKKDTEGLKESVGELAESLKTHIVEQKDDLQSINIAVYAILDILRKNGGNGEAEAEAAHQELRKHMLKK